MAKITHSQLAKLFRRLATSYTAGIDIKTAYTRETEIGGTTYRQISQHIVRQIANGHSIGDAMKATNGYFPDLAVSVVTAGERGGRLEQAFDRLAKHYESLVKFRNGFLLSIAWPLFELTFAICIIGVLILLLGMLAGDEAANWFGMGSTFSNFMFYVSCVLAVITFFAVLFIGIKHGWFGTLPMRIGRRVPLLGKTIEAMSLSRFAWTLSITENAGIDAYEMVRMALNATENFFYKNLKGPICDSLRSGTNFTNAFRASNAFPEEFLIYVENGETAGELAESMDRASQDLQARAENNMKILGTIGFVLTFMFVAGVIGFAIIRMYQKFYLEPINDLLNM